MDGATHFLTIEQKKGDKTYRHEFWYNEDTKRISKQMYEVDADTGDIATDADFISPKSFGVGEFVSNVDHYCNHPGKTFEDEKFVENLCKSYLFDEEVYE